MTQLHRWIGQAIVIVAVASLGFSVAPGDDREFTLIAKHLEAGFPVRRATVPLLSLANLLAPLNRPAGMRRFNLAVFEQPADAVSTNYLNFGETLRASLDTSWRALVRHQSRKTGEQTHIYLRPAGDAQELIVVEIRQREAAVLQVTLNPRDFARYLARPVEMADSLRSELIDGVHQ